MKKIALICMMALFVTVSIVVMPGEYPSPVNTVVFDQ